VQTPLLHVLSWQAGAGAQLTKVKPQHSPHEPSQQMPLSPSSMVQATPLTPL
jgi:hypothetical protein